MPRFFTQKVHKPRTESKSPLYVGILNGFMPCGPLQSMQIYALSTGNPFYGALSMFLFSIGTVPLMFVLGSVSTALGRKFTEKVMVAGAILVTVLGLSMLTQGFSLSGVTFTAPRQVTNVFTELGPERKSNEFYGEIIDGFQIVYSTLEPFNYPDVTFIVGIPVKWVVDTPQGSINGCNNRIIIAEYDLEHTFEYGDNIIEFMPINEGRFQYTCWMGMIRAAITVIGDETGLTD